MKFKPGSLWKTNTGVLFEIAHTQDDVVYVFARINRDQICPVVTGYMIHGQFVKGWRPYSEGDMIYRSRFQMILDESHG